MNTKLTLRMDADLIEAAKRRAEASGASVSRLVADYFALLTAEDRHPASELTPRVRELRGSLRGAGLDEDDYRRHLEEQYL